MTNWRLHKSRSRIITTAGILVLFTLTCLFTTYQSGKDLTAAYASGSNIDVGWWDCTKAVAKCLAAEAAAIAKCLQHGWLSWQCIAAQLAAAAICMDVPDNCW